MDFNFILKVKIIFDEIEIIDVGKLLFLIFVIYYNLVKFKIEKGVFVLLVNCTFVSILAYFA
tara:strand:- start:277 stop:462 length:186 start_codon:yes stop_codon:yes gene_type:complete